MQFGLPTAHKLTFLSSPPVTSTRPDLCPRARQLTLAPCATNSSEMIKQKIHVRNHAIQYIWYFFASKKMLLCLLPLVLKGLFKCCYVPSFWWENSWAEMDHGFETKQRFERHKNLDILLSQICMYMWEFLISGTHKILAVVSENSLEILERLINYPMKISWGFERRTMSSWKIQETFLKGS